MPTTSATSAKAAIAKAEGYNHCLKIESKTKDASIISIKNGQLKYSLKIGGEMVARESLTANVADSGNGGSSESASNVREGNATNSTNENHKLILKLPKAAAARKMQDESQIDADATTSSCSSSSNSCSAEDTRKVEPLKINLNTHHSQNVVPKITIRPIVNTQNDPASASASDYSSSAEDDVGSTNCVVPKLTIKSTMAQDCGSNEPHILPKLTIRSANEEDGTANTSIVPKLTIKMSDTQVNSMSTIHSPAASITTSTIQKSSSSSSHSMDQAPPPLPKLTIKTSLDGTSESIISTISPASLSPSSSSSSTSALTTSRSPSIFVSTPKSSLYAQSADTATVPKLTIKTVLKSEDTIPKLTIKTNATGSCVSTSEELDQHADNSSTKIPKLTIKTGQEHAVIITQHNSTTNTQSIPKLTIKTKSLEVDDSIMDTNDDHLLEKIPKLTIKTNETSAQVSPKFSLRSTQQVEGGCGGDIAPIPKLTISVTNLESINAPQSPKQLPLMVRQLATPSRKPDSPERVPKLMISRHDSTSIIVNHSSDNMEKVVPKLTIKTNNAETVDAKERSSKFAIKSNSSMQDDDKIPKLTIKQIPPKQQQQQQLSMDANDKCLHIDPMHLDEFPHNKIVPKITIKNLSSPKLKMKVVVEDKKIKDSKIGPMDARSFSIPNATNDKDMEHFRHLSFVNGESSNSQEFCGFYNSTDDSISNKERQNVNRKYEDMNESILYESKLINNMVDFGGRNGKTLLAESKIDFAQSQKRLPPAAAIATVDLTSSPSPGSSPAHLNCTEGDVLSSQHKQASPLLLECLQRKTSVIQTTPSNDSNNFLLNQLATSHIPLNHLLASSTLQPKPQQLNANSNISEKYPQLAERLMANGAHCSLRPSSIAAVVASSIEPMKREPFIDSIEILDTPEGSPRPPSSMSNAAVFNENPTITSKDSDFDQRKDIHERSSSENVSLKRSVEFLAEETNSTDVSPNKIRRSESATTASSVANKGTNIVNDKTAGFVQQVSKSQPPHRSRKQKHENLLKMPIEEEDPLQITSNDRLEPTSVTESFKDVKDAIVVPTVKKRGRPKKIKVDTTPATNATSKDNKVNEASPTNKTPKTRLSRVQLLRKRLAIDMVASEQPSTVINELEGAETLLEATPIRERPLRTPLRASRRATPQVLSEKRRKNNEMTTKGRKRLSSNPDVITSFNHFGGSNSSLSSACSSSSMSSTTVAIATAAHCGVNTTSSSNIANNLLINSQIDLTMSSSSSSASNGSTTATLTTVTAQGHSNSMLPPTTILSSSDPVPDVIFKPNDFSSIMAAQQLRKGDSNLLTPTMGQRGSRINSHDDEDGGLTGGSADNSGDDSASSSSILTTPTRGRGRGRGSRGARGSSGVRGPRAYRVGRGASAVTKAIAMSRPRCVGGLKHIPDPERLKNLFSPSPQVFEEDTRMSAELNQTQQIETQTFIRQPDFITNEESQSSIVSNTSTLDTSSIPQNGTASAKRPKKKKMEVCVAEDADFSVTSIAEYDWPPPKGCCPSKNRDTFMIQEQVALYLGIKSFKRKYPDLPRRQIDMEERNWLQEKGLVTEKMCDLGITAVWATDVLDIMYTDFPDKYEEYKDFIRQKHLREIKTKQKALGINVSDRGLQARDRAMLSASKWNSYFNRSRQDERLSCLDLQTLTVNVPLPASAPTTTLMHRPIAESIALAVQAESIPEPPTLLKPREMYVELCPEIGYPLAMAPGQFCEKFRQYNSLELRSFPLNTVLDDPSTLHERLRLLNQDDSDASESDINKNTSPRRIRRRHWYHRSKLNCDKISEVGNETRRSNETVSISSSSSESSSSDDSGSETDSDSESCSSFRSSEDESSPILCGVCQRTQYRNPKDMPEVFIKCFTCRRKVHPSCIEMPHRMVSRVRNYNWQCVECKCCIKCKRKQDRNKMLFCEQCDRGFHIYCLGVKTVPDGRWSCERCSVCLRCGATKPEGLSPQLLISPNGEKVKQVKHKKVKWINEYRIDHITKLREHCSMLCVPCGRAKTTRRIQIANNNTGNNSGVVSSVTTCASSAPTSTVHQEQLQQQNKTKPQVQQHQPQHQVNKLMSPPAAPGPLTTSSNMVTSGAGVSVTTTSLPPPVVA